MELEFDYDDDFYQVQKETELKSSVALPKRRLDHDDDYSYSSYSYDSYSSYYYDDYCSCDDYSDSYYYSYYDYYYSYYNYYYSYNAAPEGEDKVEETPEDVSGYWSITWYTDYSDDYSYDSYDYSYDSYSYYYYDYNSYSYYYSEDECDCGSDIDWTGVWAFLSGFFGWLAEIFGAA